MNCDWCDEPIAEGEKLISLPHIGEPGRDRVHFHAECFMRTCVGSVGHLSGNCSCYGGTSEDPPGLNRREAARQAFDLWKKITKKLELYGEREKRTV